MRTGVGFRPIYLANILLASLMLTTCANRLVAQVATARVTDPPVLASPPAQVLRGSTVSFMLSVPFTALTEAVNEISDAYREISKIELCPGAPCNYSYDVTFKRDGQARIKADQQGLQLLIPVGVSGDVSFRPKGWLGFAKGMIPPEKFHSQLSGRFEATLTVMPLIEPDWCIDPRAKLTTKWTEPPKLKSSVMDLDLAQVTSIEERIEASLHALFSSDTILSTKQVLCDLLRDQVGKVWRTYAVPIEIKDRTIYLTIQPNYVRYAGPRITTSALELGVGLGASTYVSALKRNGPPSELPTLQRAKAIKSALYIEVPAVVSLREVKAAAEQLVARETFDFSLPLTGLAVRLRHIEPTIAGRRLEFLIDYLVEAWWLPFELSGKATIGGEPRVDRAQGLVVLDQVETAVSLNSQLLGWAFKAALRRAEDQLRIRISEVAKYDARGDLEFSRREFERQVNQLDAVSGVRFHLSGLQPTLDRVEVNREGVSIFANASATLDAQVHELPPAILGWLQRLGDSPFKKNYRVVNARSVNMRTRPDKDADSVVLLSEGDWPLRIHDCRLGDQDKSYKWCDVTFGPHRGWVHQHYLAPD